MRAAAYAAGLVLTGVVAFDIAAFFLFPEQVRKIAREYRNETAKVREPQYFRPSDTRGFDIAPGARFVSRHPPEAGPYDVWANALGCFDDQPPEGVAPDIYLAGDSFTWGFSPYETKFGTVIERETGLLTYACGVPHTGPRHQFDKFLEIAATLPDWPAVVIVNIYTNDIANDYFFPHTTVVDGRMVEHTFLERTETRTSVHRLANPEPLDARGPVPALAKRYSTTAVILSEIWRRFADPQAGYRHIYELYDTADYPFDEDIAAQQRCLLEDWLDHARRHGYELRISPIPAEAGIGQDNYAGLRDFVSENGGVAWDFEGYLRSGAIDPDGLYWSGDDHFNPEGNAAYAAFLLERLAAEAADGTLPARFAASGAEGM